MNRKLLFAVLASVVSAPCLAEARYSLGLSAGSLKYDDGSGSMKGLSAAYSVNPNLYFEISHLTGRLDSCSYAYCEDYDYKNTSVYAVLRSTGRAYFLGKVGFFSTTADDDRVNKAGIGVGAGFEVSQAVHLEIEYLEKEVSVRYTGVALRYWF